jgi:ABC-type transport system involved in multi-copper enzyme maturation permease subunit
MLMGPVFRAELLRTARQRRFYVLRLVYGLVLLLIVSTGYQQMRWVHAVASVADVARYATQAFNSFALMQLIAVLLLVPAVFGGAIADEKQRKTLHYIMASQLSSGEIIVDKVLGRSAHLAVFVAIGLPIVSLLGLFGGISADSVVVAYLGTFSTGAFAVAMTVLVSTLARRVRDAILTSYLLMLIWLLVPPLIFLFGSVLRPALYFWIQPVNDALADLSPVTLWLRSRFWMGLRMGMPALVDRTLSMVGAQLVGAALLLLLAIWRLRPTFRRQEETPARRTWFSSRKGRLRRRSAQPDCGDDPIWWKEHYFAPFDRFTRLVLLPAIVFITLPLTVMTAIQSEAAVASFWWRGFEARRSLPDGFLRALQVDLGWYTALWLLAVAGAMAASVTIEREKDTWESLTATPLTAREIFRGKLLGALWQQRGFFAVLIFLYTVSLVTGAAHPLAWLASIALLALLTWFVAIVGFYCSLRSSGTSRAMGSTLAILAVFNGTPVILLLWFFGAIGWESSYSVLGAMPSYVAWSMASPESIDRLWSSVKAPNAPPAVLASFVSMGVGLFAIYMATALALTRRITGQLDHWLERMPAPSSRVRGRSSAAREGLMPVERLPRSLEHPEANDGRPGQG